MLSILATIVVLICSFVVTSVICRVFGEVIDGNSRAQVIVWVATLLLLGLAYHVLDSGLEIDLPPLLPRLGGAPLCPDGSLELLDGSCPCTDDIPMLDGRC
jgi:hypothetical protein